MVHPRELEEDDEIRIDAEPLSGALFRVSNVQVEDIGIVEVVAVTLVSQSDDVQNQAITGTSSDSLFTVISIGEGDEEEIKVRKNAIRRL